MINHPFSMIKLVRVATLAALVLPLGLGAGTIRLAVGEIDTSASPEVTASALRTLASRGGSPTGEALALVQFEGPVRPPWREAVERSGGRVIAYVPDHAYLVTLTPARQGAVRAAAGVSWMGAVTPELKIHPSLKAAALAPSAEVAVTILSVDDLPARWLAQRGLAVNATRLTPMGWQATRATVPAGVVPQIAQLWSVFHIERQPVYVRHGERGAQTAAGNYSPGGTAPTGPGYVSWLASHGLSGAPGLVVQVQDDGLDQGIATNAPGTAHPDILGRIAGIFNATPDPLGDSRAGHGQINAGIIVGNATGGLTDPAGYLLGQGLAPQARVYGTKIFANDGTFDIGSHTFTDLARAAQDAGAIFSNNSWGAGYPFANGDYTSDAAEFDALARDCDPVEPGNQPMIYFFSVGNDGTRLPGGANSIGSPATAKNVIAVGAGENSDADGTDGCFTGPSDANNIRDLADFSSRGPCDDGRLGVTLFAVGTHVQGPASTAAGYDGTGVCDRYWPSGQTLYARSSGTSHSCPTAAGAGMVVYEYFQTQLAPRGHTATPSPALMRAVLTNTATDMAGGSDGLGGTLGPVPNTEQGWGAVNLNTLFSMRDALLSWDQTHLFTGSGQVWEQRLFAADSTKPIKITLAWTDAPGVPLAGQALVNDLDLEVDNGSSTFLGNVFSGGQSVAGGSPDRLHNLEAVFVPSPAGLFTVRVRAFNIAGDGVPGSGGPLDQDFALFIWNATLLSPAGAVEIDKTAVGLNDTLGLLVRDADLTGAGSMVISVGASSGDVVNVTLTATVPGVFEGTLTTAPGTPTADAVLQVAHGDTVTAIYNDTDNGSGTPAVVTDTATVDGLPPVITGVTVTGAGHDRLTVAFQTDEPARPAVLGGLYTGDGSMQASGPNLATSHVVDLLGLSACTTYLFRAEARDAVGNLGVHDNAGLWHLAATGPAALSDGFDGTPDPRWTHSAADGTDNWAIRANGNARSAPNVFSYEPGPSSVSDASLATPSFLLPGELRFWHTYGLENGFDGAVLEISIDGGPWTDLGPLITQGGYTGTISMDYESPIGGREAWTGGVAGTFTEVRVNLTGLSGLARVRFRFASDNSVSSNGWYIDDVTVEGGLPCTNANPTAVDDPVMVTSGAISFEARANDSDPEGQPLTVAGVTQPAHGTAAINPDGSLTYVAGPTYAGSDAFVYTVRDPQGGAAVARVLLSDHDPLLPGRIVEYLLGITTDPTGLNVNGDDRIDVGDLVRSLP